MASHVCIMDRGGDDEALNFAIVQTVEPSLIDIRNLGAGDIVLRNGKSINNPVGETRILNTGGSIVAESGPSDLPHPHRHARRCARGYRAPADFEGETAIAASRA